MVTQPAASQYQELIKSLQEKESKIHEWRRLAKSRDMWMRIDSELQDAKLFLAEMESHTDFEFGQLERREEDVVDYRGRHCIADWAVFKVNKRSPSPADWDYIGPQGGFLGTLDWNSCLRIGELAYDLYVRKNGAQSGMTFGVVAGCPAGVKMFDKPFEDALEEYVIVKEEKWDVCQFAERGDSGSLVITHDGKAVGTIVGAYKITSVILVVDEQGVIDLNYLREFRREDGSVHIEDCYTRRLFDRGIVVVQSLSMIVSRAGLDEYELVIDC